MGLAFLLILKIRRNNFAVSKNKKKNKMEITMIGNKIADARKKLSVSQAELAQRLFISPQAVGKWERGESIPDLITFNRLAKILGVDLNYFSDDFSTASVETTFKDNNVDIEQNGLEDNSLSNLLERQLLTDFSGSNLQKSDFAGVTAHKRKFNASDLRGSDFAGADLTGSSFVSSNISEANFDGANLSDCILSTSDFSDASFNKTILVHTEFSKSTLVRTKFRDTKLVEVKFTMIDIRETIFENCVFNGVDFKNANLRGLCLDGQTFIDVEFHNTMLNGATFNGSTLKNVSFRSTALTNKFYRTVKTISFDGAMMDKLTFAAFKGIGADLSKVTVI
jgi:uncharacterized protein YjbI with pentapeptide repeats